jgi:choline dehydrogenase-like flavoprotein
MYRMRENDFLAIPHEAGVSPAWPITYDDLEPYYCEAERIYRVHGASEGDPTEPPRSFPFPHPPLPHAPLVASLVDRLRLYQASPAPLIMGQTENASCVQRATPTTVDSMPRWTRRPPPFVPP